jgi:uncharacterized DUF497 family protein
MQFEWDLEKDGKNQLTHGVSFAEASTIRITQKTRSGS